MIHFRLRSQSGVPAYVQLMEQVRRAVLQGALMPGDRLPAAREVVAALAINPNTVLKAYGQLEHEGIVVSRPGSGTFVADSAPRPIAEAIRRQLVPTLEEWVAQARRAGLGDEAINALFAAALETAGSEVA